MSAFSFGFSQGFNFGMFSTTFGFFPTFNTFGFMGNHFCCHNTPIFLTPLVTGRMNFYPTTPVSLPFPQVSSYDVKTFSQASQISWSDYNLTFNNNFSSKVNDNTSKKTTNNDAKDLKETWKNKKPNLTDEFYDKVVEISKRIKCDPNDLMGVMNSESGLDHTATNSIGATGLIQFVPDTASWLKTSTEELKSMSAVEQLDYVEKYLIAMKKEAGFTTDAQLSLGDLSALVFLPKYAKNNVLTRDGEKYYSANIALDTNKDNKITKSELAARVRNNYMA